MDGTCLPGLPVTSQVPRAVLEDQLVAGFDTFKSKRE